MLAINLALLLGSAGAFMVASPFSARATAATIQSPDHAAPAMARLASAPFMQEEAAGDAAAEPEPEPEPEEVAEAPVATMTPPPGWMAVEEIWDPSKKANIRVEGGKTLKTFKMPEHAERVQYMITSPTGRPLKARVELWIGPIRKVHEMILNCMNGQEYPLKATLQFKKLSPVLQISTDGEFEFPLLCNVFVPTPEESTRIGKLTAGMFNSAPLKDRVQGGSTIDKKGGAIRSFKIDPSWEKTQIMVWSKDVGKKSFRTNIEVLQGPNNQKQHISLQCGGSTQPYHCVIDTPGPDWTVRCNSKKFVEDGLFEIALAPFGPQANIDPVQVMTGGSW
jgi:hypothetical protein